MKPTINKFGYCEPESKFEIALRKKETGEIFKKVYTLDELLHADCELFCQEYFELVYTRRYLGYADKQGTQLVEGDIVYFQKDNWSDGNWVIGWGSWSWMKARHLEDFKNGHFQFAFDPIEARSFAVRIGNVYDNPELLPKNIHERNI